jgi:branched-chain amino acid transport system substrate-binding protein
VLGGVRHPLNTADFSSFILQAQASKAKIIGMANSGEDALNAIKQSAEFGVTAGGQRLGGLLLLINQIHGLGLAAANGVIVSEAFYWDLDDGTRAFAKAFEATMGKKPNMIQAGVYSAVTHYLKALQAAGSDDGLAVAAKMRELPVNDFMSQNIRIREDGRVMRNMHLFEVKRPSESKDAWDYYKLVATVRGEDAFRPLDEGGCPLVRK